MRISTVTGLKICFSFRSGSQARLEIAAPPLSLLPVEYLTPAIGDRAVEVQLLLADRPPGRSGRRSAVSLDTLPPATLMGDGGQNRLDTMTSARRKSRVKSTASSGSNGLHV